MQFADLIPDLSTVTDDLIKPLVPIPVCREFLIPFYRHDRIPLGQWAQLVLDKFDEAGLHAHRDPCKACEIMTDFLNEAALIEVYFGRPQEAKSLCRSSIGLTEHVLRNTGRLSVVRHMFQPYINEGRLDRISGRWDEALDKFQRLRVFHCGEPITIGSFTLTDSHRSAIESDASDFMLRMNANYLIDSLGTLLKAKRFSETLSFVKQNETPEAHWFDPFLPEASVIALCSLGLCKTAGKIVDQYLSDIRNPHRPIFLYRRVEILMQMGQVEAARPLCRDLATAYLSADISVQKLNLRLLSQLGNLLSTLSDDVALAVVTRGLDLATAIRDVIFQEEFLNLFLRLTPTTSEQAVVAKHRLDELPRESWYGAARSGMAKTWFLGDIGQIDVMREKALSLQAAFA